jgi:glycosyltransferase involved in cell wall biosynthesis
LLDELKIAIVCDWLTDYAGAERVVYEMHQLFPKAPIYTSLYDPKRCKVFKFADVRESWLGKLPFARAKHRLFFPMMPKVFESMDLSEFDIVLSSCHSASKGVITQPETMHVSYCHSPVRYLWDHSHSYQKRYESFSPLKLIYKPILHKIRLWDRIAADRVDRYVANSAYVGRRIQKYYGRESEVIHPPADLNRFQAVKNKGEHYLAVGRLIPYKRFDLVVEAFNRLGKSLVVVGTGSELAKLQKLAGENIQFLGRVSEEALEDAYGNAKALIFPQLEDFGIVPLEAMGSGTPVLAFGEGGALETVKDGISGLFFKEQSVDSIMDCVKRFEAMEWPPEEVSKSVSEFSAPRFKAELRHFIEAAWKEHQKDFS